MVVLLHDRNPAAAAGDDKLIRVQQGVDGVQFHDLYRIGGGHDPPESLAGFFDDVIAFFAFLVGLLDGHVPTQYFGGSVKCLVIRIHDDLGQNGADCAVNTPVQQFFPDAVLQVVADIALAHGGAYGHGRGGVVRVRLAKFVHSGMDHAHLGGVAVGDGDLIAFLQKVGDGFCGFLNGHHLLRKGGAQSAVSECDDCSFFHDGSPCLFYKCGDFFLAVFAHVSETVNGNVCRNCLPLMKLRSCHRPDR